MSELEGTFPSAAEIDLERRHAKFTYEDSRKLLAAPLALVSQVRTDGTSVDTTHKAD